MKDYPPPLKKKKKKVLDHYLHHDLGMLPLLRCFFAHLLILQYPDHHQNLISSSLYYSGPVHKISSQSVHNFLSNVVHRQTNKQTDRQTNATKNITSFAKEVMIQGHDNLTCEESMPYDYIPQFEVGLQLLRVLCKSLCLTAHSSPINSCRGLGDTESTVV